jgi:hypothetical protein
MNSLPPPEQGWQPIEMAPKDGTAVLDAWDDFRFPIAWERMPGKPLWGWRVGRFEASDWLLFVEPTHWMPLPPPPSGEPS